MKYKTKQKLEWTKNCNDVCWSMNGVKKSTVWTWVQMRLFFFDHSFCFFFSHFIHHWLMEKFFKFVNRTQKCILPYNTIHWRRFYSFTTMFSRILHFFYVLWISFLNFDCRRMCVPSLLIALQIFRFLLSFLFRSSRKRNNNNKKFSSERITEHLMLFYVYFVYVCVCDK